MLNNYFSRSAELDSFTDKHKKLKTIVQDLETALKEKLKECDKLQAELETARNETMVIVAGNNLSLKLLLN